MVDPGGKESIWDLDHLAVAGSASGSAVQLVLDPELALDNLVPTHAIMRILRDTAASAVAVMASVNASAAALQLADLDHEQSLTVRIERAPTLGPRAFVLEATVLVPPGTVTQTPVAIRDWSFSAATVAENAPVPFFLTLG